MKYTLILRFNAHGFIYVIKRHVSFDNSLHTGKKREFPGKNHHFPDFPESSKSPGNCQPY